jgi:formate-dependent nitrite reductase cytochrome c552 subunit
MKRSSLLPLLVVALLLAACAEDPEQFGSVKSDPNAPAENQDIEVEPRIPIIPTFPCSSCHRYRLPNPKRRELVQFHTVRNKELHHGNAKAWCYNCHSEENIDRLIISSGELVTFNEAFKLCGSCHGDKLRDWNQGVHGKTRGHWNGVKRRLSCTACHNPHRPKFRPIQPEPPPDPPTELHE